MSNYLAIATVTETIRRIILNSQSVDFSFPVSTLPLDEVTEVGDKGQLNLFLFHIEHNQAYTNLELPARTSDGYLTKRPTMALNLHYLITAFGDGTENDAIKAQSILGYTIRALNDHPVLTGNDILTTINTLGVTTFLGSSNLDEQFEPVKFLPYKTSPEELSKLWSSLFRTNYRVSVVYLATVVLIESEEPIRQIKPVRESQLGVVQIRHPVIERVDPSRVISDQEVTLSILGYRLSADQVAVLIDGEEISSNYTEMNERKITFTTATPIRAGIRNIQVVHQIAMTDRPFTLFTSNLGSFAYCPRILSDPPPARVGETVELDVSPIVYQDQKGYVMIGEHMALIHEREVTRTSTYKLQFTVPNIEAGTYPLRLNIDGAEWVNLDEILPYTEHFLTVIENA